MADEAATVRYTSQPAESLRASRLINRRAYRLMSVFPAILAITGLAVLPFLGWPAGAPEALTLWTIAVLMFGLASMLPAITRRRLVRNYPELFDEETVITIDGTGLHARKGAARSDRDWVGITDYIENHEFIVIRRGRLPIAIIPKRAFREPADQALFVAVLRAHLTGAGSVATA